MRGYSPEEWWHALVRYTEAFDLALGVWVPGSWALAGALCLPPIAACCFRWFPNRYARIRMLFAPFAGGFAGGYFQAMSLRAETCDDFKGLICIISAPPQALALIILASMLSVVFVHLSLPGRKFHRRLVRLCSKPEEVEY